MSVELQTSHRTQNTTEASSRVPAKRSYSEFLKGVNTRFKHLSDKVLPASPYLLKVPTERPFHLGSRFVSNWAVGDNRPFAPEEEHLQYMTFLPHQVEDTLLVAVGGWSDERGNIMEEDTSKVPSIATSPSVDTPKQKLQRKKISLSDYKKKAYETPKSPPRSATPVNRRNGTDRLTPAVKPKSPREPVPTPKVPVILPSKRKATTSVTTDNCSDNANGISQSKSSRDGNSRSTPSSHKPPPSARESPPPTKKPRLSTTKEPPDNKPTRQRNAPPVVPALLSPTLPPTSVTPRLPRLLSPTLPPDIEEELAKIKGGELSIDRISSPRKAPSPSTITGSKPERPLPKSNKPRPHSSSTSSSSDKTTKARVSSSSSKPQDNSVARPVPSNNQRSRAVDHTQSQISSKPKGTTQLAKPKLIVKLRYGRSNRKRIEALLRFSGKYKSTPHHQSSKQKREPESQRKSKTAPSSKSTEVQRAEKRPRQTDEDDSQGSVPKRQKSATLPASERPRTPATTAFKSPSVPQQPTSVSKGQFLTPSKDLRATTMRRLGSGDGDSKLPAGLDRGMNTSTPGSAEKATTKHSPVTPSDNPQNKPRDTAESRSWQEESQKYFNIGRELKRSSQRYPGPHATDADHKLSAAIAVEAVLCFILAFILDDRHRTLNRRLGDSSTWLSIVPYWKMVKGNMDKYPHLHALCSLLGAVFHEIIHGLDLERLAMTALPSDHSPAPTPGSDGNTVTSEESKKQQQHRDFMDLRKRLVDSHREARALWLEGSRKLSEDVLTHQYPETWSKRSMNFSERGREKALVLGEYSGEYFLPLDRTATPLEAIRFGWVFLTEWTKKERVEWKGQLGL
ncbi:hypothetical protein, variant [Blastomyces dermatitidis ATCC 18188]|uniref:Ell binding protein Ebp1 C-terminal domain-containing protein n=1 Tax=Ajellomyces dermatitidis (strain ATCC 18188 / CBS 674.68) TaxID=653446 RepID=F2TE62_AJEDA|nr:hypothetical protein BDDG_04467 [Blastomyces dermatitidis ATCC 18188]KMW67527.1 hypothetical protein, variant [Blastomyces dermatitidis ATCC 18188]